MKIIAGTLLATLLTFNVGAQAFENGKNYITLGFGFDPYYRYNNGFGNNYKYGGVGPIILTYERGITEKLGIGRIGVGGGVAQSFYTSRWYNGNWEHIDRTSRTAIFARAAYHFDFGIDKMDVYAGVGGGVYIYNRTHKTEDPDDFVVKNTRGSVGGGHYVFGGIRYLFTNGFGVYAEVGHGLSAINGGFVFKF